MDKLLAIDGLYVVRRVYEANPEPDSPEKAETALRNAFFSFRRLLDGQVPTHVLPAFEAGNPSWRNDLHPAYRQGRKPMAPELKARLPGFLDRLAGLGLHPVSVEGAEARDAIATAVQRWLGERRGEAVIASTDKHLHMLIAQGARIWDHFKGEWHDREWVEHKFGVPPERLGDLLALVGDAAEGIPGVAKIGWKTAARLLASYKDLDGVMAGPGMLLDPLGQRLRAGRDDARLSRRLVALKTDVRLGVTWNGLRYQAQGERA